MNKMLLFSIDVKAQNIKMQNLYSILYQNNEPVTTLEYLIYKIVYDLIWLYKN